MNPDDIPDDALAIEFMCHGVPVPVLRALDMTGPAAEFPAPALVNVAVDMRASAWWFAAPDPYDGVRGEAIAYVTATSPSGRVEHGISARAGNAISGEIG